MDARKLIAAAMDTTIAATAVVKPVFRICMVPAPDLPVKRRPFRDEGGRTPRLAFPGPLCGLPDVPIRSLPQKQATQHKPRFRSALRLSVWHFHLFRFSILEPDHAGVSALRAEEGKVLQHRMRSDLRSRLTAAPGAAEPIQFRSQGFRHGCHLLISSAAKRTV